MKKSIDLWFALLKATAIACLVLMVALVFANVVLRYVFNSGLVVSEETSRLLFVYITFIGAAIALREHLHLGIDSVVARLPAHIRRVCLIVAQALMLYATWLLLSGSWEQATINWSARSPVLGITKAAVYGIAIVFSLTTGALLISNILRALRGAMTGDEVAQVLGISQRPEPTPQDAPQTPAAVHPLRTSKSV